MKKNIFIVLFSFCLLFLCPVSVFAAEEDINVSDPDSFNGVSDDVNAQMLDTFYEMTDDHLVSSSDIQLFDLENGSFIPDLFVSGNALPYGQVFSLAMNRVSFSQNVVFNPNISSALTAYSLSQINFSDYTYTIEGFENDATYNGVVYFQVFIPSESNYVFNPAPGYTYSTDAPLNVLSPIFPTSITCYDSSGNLCTVYYSYSSSSYGGRSGLLFTFYILLQDYYIPPSNGVVEVNKLVLSVTWSSPSCKRYYMNNDGGSIGTPLSYYRVYNPYVTYLSRSYSGTVEMGRHDFNSDVSQDQQDQLVNGYDSSSGDDANSSLQSGLAVYESDEAQAQADFTSKMDAYEFPDVAPFASGVSFVASCMTSWFNGLGIFQIVLFVAFGLMIFNFISRYRGGGG